MFDKIIYPRSLKDLGKQNTPITTGILFSDDKEYYFLYIPDDRNQYKPLIAERWLSRIANSDDNDFLKFNSKNKSVTPNDWYYVEYFGRCSHGVSIGDFIADDCKFDCKSIGLNDSINPTNIIDCCNAIINNLLENKPDRKMKDGILAWAQLAFKSFHTLTMYTQLGKNADNPKKYDRCNLIILPLLAEVLMEIRDDKFDCDFKNSRKIIMSMNILRPKVKKVVTELISKETNLDDIKDVETLEDEYGIAELKGRIKFFKNKYSQKKSPTIEDLYIPCSFPDFISYLLHQYVVKKYYFTLCPNCNRYFTYHTDSKLKYCSRYIIDPNKSDIGKKCNDIGRFRARTRWLSTNEVGKLYQNNYSKVLYMKKTGKISISQFENWSSEARSHRDDCLSEKITIEQFKTWIDTYRFH